MSEHLRGIFNRKRTEKRRKEMRNSGTAAEAMLWKHLQRRQILGKKFRRQEGIGPYIVDFYCPECRVIVELDGAPHFEELGMKVIRLRICVFLPPRLRLAAQPPLLRKEGSQGHLIDPGCSGDQAIEAQRLPTAHL